MSRLKRNGMPVCLPFVLADGTEAGLAGLRQTAREPS